jgi:hypothetical protein
MSILRSAYLSFLMICLLSPTGRFATAADVHSLTQTETIIAIRHGEKPPDSLGQLNCKGLNRSLALPGVLLTRYGRPNFIFAPNPSVKSTSASGTYSYVRPLATIEPVAIAAHLPVNTQIGLGDIHRLQHELTSRPYRNSVVFIAWEHAYLDKFAKALVKDYGGDPAQIPFWPEEDYDSIFVIRLSMHGNHRSVAFSREQEGLTDRLSSVCPDTESRAYK